MLKLIHRERSRMNVVSESEADTKQFGKLLAISLFPGAIVGLVGDLGSGKTRIVKAVAEGLGVEPEEINSPTFTLIQEYSGRLILKHCDTYRLRDPKEFVDLGLDELLAEDTVALIEWADRVMPYLPSDVLTILIDATSIHSRTFQLDAGGKSSQRIIDDMDSFFLNH